MKKYISFILFFTIFLSGCSQEELFVNEAIISKTFIASFEQNVSRTYVEEGNLLRWTAGDQISLFEGYTLNSKYQFDGETGDNGGTFSKVNSPFGTGNELSSHYAVYPYASNVKITESGVITADLPSVQCYAENSFGLGANTMVAVTEDTDDTFLKFKNVGGYLKLQLYGDDVTVKAITLTGNSNEKLAGKATITPVYGQAPTIAMTAEATDSITLDCGSGVEVGSSAETATAFWIVVPPTVFENGFEVTITDINGGTFSKSTSNEITIERNVIKPMPAFEVEMVETIPYVTFTADELQTLTMSKAVETLEYSVNGGEWKPLDTTIVTFGGDNGDLRLRGKNSNGTATNSSDYSKIRFGNETPVTCTGDIRTLIDYENYATVYTGDARFRSLFYNCYQLTSAPVLPATTLAGSCYEYMFSGCSNLTEAPSLPATNLAESCYKCMFSLCSSLTEAPSLPATWLEHSCYRYMFSDCSSLTEAPALPATTLANYCYQGMFYGCTSLTEAPALPAIWLEFNCYSHMFHGCTSLTSAPALPATTLAEGCCSHMFHGCTSLTEAPILSAIILEPACCWAMFSGCTSLTSAPALPAIFLASGCYDSMFEHCTSLTSAPELPATTLAEGCYGYMFSGCTSLTSAPVLPAMTLAEDCYYFMFDGCTKLNKVTMLATDISATSCLSLWLNGVSSTGTFIKSPEMDESSFEKGSGGIPSGWTVENYIE